MGAKGQHSNAGARSSRYLRKNHMYLAGGQKHSGYSNNLAGADNFTNSLQTSSCVNQRPWKNKISDGAKNPIQPSSWQ